MQFSESFLKKNDNHTILSALSTSAFANESSSVVLTSRHTGGDYTSA